MLMTTVVTLTAIIALSVFTGCTWSNIDYRRTWIPWGRVAELTIRSLAAWGLITIILANLLNSPEVRDVGITVLVPSTVVSIALVVMRRPLSARIMRREMNLNK